MRYTNPLHFGARLSALLALPCAVFSQESGSLSISGGTATDQFGRGSAAVAVSPRFSAQLGPSATLGVGGSATRFANETWSLGAGTDMAIQHALNRHAAITLNATLNGSRLGGSASGTFASADVLPALELRLSRFRVYGGARAASGSAPQTAQVGGLPWVRERESRIVRSGVGSVMGALIYLASGPSLSGSAGVRQERFVVAGAAAVDHMASFALSRCAAGLSGSIGRRMAADEARTIANAALSLPISGSASLDVALGRYASNPVMGTPGGNYATAGISWSLGRRGEWVAPSPARIPPPARGLTRLSIRASDARTVHVAGDFNEWHTVPAQRADNGVWYADLRIPAGRHRYAFRINGSEWRVPDGATAVDDGFGGKSAWMIVQTRSQLDNLKEERCTRLP